MKKYIETAKRAVVKVARRMGATAEKLEVSIGDRNSATGPILVLQPYDYSARMAAIKDIETSRLLEIAVAEKSGQLVLLPTISRPYNARLAEVPYLLGVFIRELNDGTWNSKVADRIARLTHDETVEARKHENLGI